MGWTELSGSWIDPERWTVEQMGPYWEMKPALALLHGEAVHMACSHGAEFDGQGHTENFSSSLSKLGILVA